jgi:hypothetical protein
VGLPAPVLAALSCAPCANRARLVADQVTRFVLSGAKLARRIGRAFRS